MSETDEQGDLLEETGADETVEDETVEDETGEKEAGLEWLMKEEADALFKDGGGDTGPVESPFEGGPADAADAEGRPGHPFEAEEPVSADLDARAAEVAQDLLEDAEADADSVADTADDHGDGDEPRDDGDGATAPASATAAGESTSTKDKKDKKDKKDIKKDKILVGLLVTNLILMGLMMAIPGGFGGAKPEGHKPPVGPTHDPSNSADPFHAPLQEPQEFLPSMELYDAGQRLVVKGNYDRAIVLFERYLVAHPDLHAFQLQIVYSSLAYCYQRVGRRGDAIALMARSENLKQLTALPDDLWEAARRAEVDGRGADMRRYYARFLLQQDQLGKRWASQGKISEAYMKIGDSYRIDAERSAQRAELARHVKPGGAGKKKGH